MTKTKSEEVYAFLGPCGAMLSGSKSAYRNANPKNLVWFNANVCLLKEEKVSRFFGLFSKTNTKAEKVWWGDFDLTANRNWLKNLAEATGETVILLTEMDGRFENEDNPLYKNFVYKVTPSGDESFGEWYADNVMITDEVIELILPEDGCGCEICDCELSVEEAGDTPQEIGIDAVEEVTKALQEMVAEAAPSETQPTPEAIAEATEVLNTELAKVEKAKAKRAPKPKAAPTEPVAEKSTKKPRAKKAAPAEPVAEKPVAEKKPRKPRAKKVVDTAKTPDTPSI